jgi:hypothetical protein
VTGGSGTVSGAAAADVSAVTQIPTPRQTGKPRQHQGKKKSGHTPSVSVDQIACASSFAAGRIPILAMSAVWM